VVGVLAIEGCTLRRWRGNGGRWDSPDAQTGESVTGPLRSTPLADAALWTTGRGYGSRGFAGPWCVADQRGGAGAVWVLGTNSTTYHPPAAPFMCCALSPGYPRQFLPPGLGILGHQDRLARWGLFGAFEGVLARAAAGPNPPATERTGSGAGADRSLRRWAPGVIDRAWGAARCLATKNWKKINPPRLQSRGQQTGLADFRWGPNNNSPPAATPVTAAAAAATGASRTAVASGQYVFKKRLMADRATTW